MKINKNLILAIHSDMPATKVAAKGHIVSFACYWRKGSSMGRGGSFEI